MAVHHAVGISRQRNSSYRPSRVNVMAQGLYTPDPSLNPTHLSIRTGRATTTHYIHHQVSLIVSHNTTLVPSLGLRIGPVCEAGLSAGMRRERVPPRIRKKEKKESSPKWGFGVILGVEAKTFGGILHPSSEWHVSSKHLYSPNQQTKI